MRPKISKKSPLFIFFTLVLHFLSASASNTVFRCGELISKNARTTVDADDDFRRIVHKHANIPAVYSVGGTYGVVPKNARLFRGVAGPDHELGGVLRFISGDRRYELMSPDFKSHLSRANNGKRSFDSAYALARSETIKHIDREVSTTGLKTFAFRVTSGSSAGISADKKKGPILKFSSEINTALNYAASAFQRNLLQGRRVNPVIFDASGNGDLTLGSTKIPEPGNSNEYDFLSNVSIRHVNSIYIGLTRLDSASVWEMPWIKITPTNRGRDGSFESFFVEFVNVEKKLPMEIYEQSGVYPEHELTNLQFQKPIGLFESNKPPQLSSILTESDLLNLRPFLSAINYLNQSK